MCLRRILYPSELALLLRCWSISVLACRVCIILNAYFDEPFCFGMELPFLTNTINHEASSRKNVIITGQHISAECIIEKLTNEQINENLR